MTHNDAAAKHYSKRYIKSEALYSMIDYLLANTINKNQLVEWKITEQEAQELYDIIRERLSQFRGKLHIV